MSMKIKFPDIYRFQADFISNSVTEIRAIIQCHFMDQYHFNELCIEYFTEAEHSVEKIAPAIIILQND